MKTYMIVTNDEYELPVAGEFLGLEKVAEWLGLKLGTVRTYMQKGFPPKAQYKAVIVKERQIEDVGQYQKDYSVKWRFRTDRTEYQRQWYQRRKAQNEERNKNIQLS